MKIQFLFLNTSHLAYIYILKQKFRFYVTLHTALLLFNQPILLLTQKQLQAMHLAFILQPVSCLEYSKALFSI